MEGITHGEAEYYRHSGVTPIPSIAITSAAALAVAGVLGFLYTQLVLNESGMIAAVILTLVFAGVIGFGVATLSEITKLRSTSIPVAIAVMAGLFGLWVAWGTDIAARGFWEGAEFTLAPTTIKAYINELNLAGSFAFTEGAPVVGFLLDLTWFCEALLFVGGSAFVCWVIQGEAVFCDTCDRWVKTEPLKQIDRDGTAELVARLEQGDMSAVYFAREANPGAKNYVQVEITRCDCGTCNYITLTSVRHDEEGTMLEERLITNQRVTDGDALRMMDPRGLHPDDYADEETRYQRRSGSCVDAAEQTHAQAPRPPRIELDHSASDERTIAAQRIERERRRRKAAQKEALRAEAGQDQERMRRAERKRQRRAKQAQAGSDSGVRFRCPHCEKTHRVPTKYAGRKGRCPSCKEAVRVPALV